MTSHNSIPNFKQRIVAHRGWQQRYPENSYAGIKAALELGVQHIEIDVHLTADHVPVLCHDHHLQRLCQLDRDIRECTLLEAKKFSFHEPERMGQQHYPTQVLTLAECAELIQQYPEAKLYVELKRRSLYHFDRATVLAAVHQSLKAITGQALIISFDIEVLQLAKKNQLSYPLIPVLVDKAQWQSPELTELNPDMVFFDVDLLKDKAEINTWPYPVTFYEIGNYQQACELLDAGAAMIESFCCGELLESADR